MELSDRAACYRAVESRDPRFDGRLFVGVRSTGIYCRPICPARTPKFENCRFFLSAAAAQAAGFRPCLRCRPETAPDLASWRGTSNTVSRALALIADGALGPGSSGVEALASRLGLGGRQLRRLFDRHLGASPIAVAQTRRMLFAKQLIHETQMPFVDVALAAGFGSVRRFNETFRDVFGRPPSALRRGRIPQHESSDTRGGVTLRIRYMPPYDWAALLAFLAARAIDGVESVKDDAYSRTVMVDRQHGIVEVRHIRARQALLVTVRFPTVRALPSIVERVRRVFDVGADIGTIGAHLSRDALLGPLVRKRPGLRVPGGWDEFELAVRAILGQQITIAAARRLGSELVALCGGTLSSPAGAGSLTRTFPTAEQVAAADLRMLPMPSARQVALRSLAETAVLDPNLFHASATTDDTIARLRAIRGIGEWTAHYIAMRAFREPDAFPAQDVGLLRGAAVALRGRATPAGLLERAEQWRPWRAYAAQHLWTSDAAVHLRQGFGGQTERLRHV